MRKLAIVVSVLIATSAFGQESKQNGLFVFVSNPSYTYSSASGGNFDGAFGVALQRMFTARVSAELSVSRQSDYSRATTFNPDGTTREIRSIRTFSTPIDLTARYHFLNDSSWKPYAGIGARRVDSRNFGDLTGGVVWQFRPSLGLRFDAKLLVGDRSRFDDRVNGSLGLAWHF